MATLKEYLAKIDKIVFDKTDGSKSISNDIWEVRLSTGFLSGTHETFRVQVVIHIHYKGLRVDGWGSDSNEMNDEIVLWFIKKRVAVFGLEYLTEKNERKIGENIFGAL